MSMSSLGSHIAAACMLTHALSSIISSLVNTRTPSKSPWAKLFDVVDDSIVHYHHSITLDSKWCISFPTFIAGQCQINYMVYMFVLHRRLPVLLESPVYGITCYCQQWCFVFIMPPMLELLLPFFSHLAHHLFYREL